MRLAEFNFLSSRFQSALWPFSNRNCIRFSLKMLFCFIEMQYLIVLSRVDPLSICDTPELKDKNEFDIQVEVCFVMLMKCLVFVV